MYDDIQFSRAGLALDPIHDNRHQLPDDPFARESVPFSFHIPEAEIGAFTYTWVNKAGEAGAIFTAFGPGVGPEPMILKLADRKVSDSMDFSDWRVDNYWMKHDLTFRHAEAAWDSPEASVEFTFDAIHPPYAYGSHPDGCPQFAAVNRIEQAGKMEGLLTLKGRKIPFSVHGHRDHSWGRRIWGAIMHYNWYEAKSLDGKTSVHYWRLLALGKDYIRGYVVKDGLMSEVTKLETDVIYDDDYWQRSLRTTLFDDVGRKTYVESEFYTHAVLGSNDAMTLREGVGKARIDNQEAGGWLEAGWSNPYLDFITSNKIPR